VACTERTIAATPEQVWAVLAQPMSYDRWVVGAKDIRAADGTWPETGSSLHHTSGFGPLTLKDKSKVMDAEPPRLLILEARGRPFGAASIELRLEAEGSGTLVTMIEHAVRPALARILNPIVGPLLHARNVESLRRLENLTRERADAG